MCGIAGVYSPRSGVGINDSVLVEMASKMAHRGPDGSGIWREPQDRCAFAHRRLSIIDLSNAASQPMTNQAGTVHVVLNGEIYNHAELRTQLESLGKYYWRTDHSDTEVLLHAYEEWGADCVRRFHGMFSIAIYDARHPSRPVLRLIRDRVGIKPMYVAKTPGQSWVFASEIRALFAHPDIRPEMDGTAFWHYLTFIVTPAPLTLFKGIFKLPAGHIINIDHTGRAAAERYWDITPDPERVLAPGDLSEQEAADELTRLLKKSIERRMVSDVPFGVLLSGGVDSSMNVALMSELMDHPVRTFTIGYEDEDDSNEFHYARRVSARYGTEHHETLINQRDAQEFLPLLVQLQDEPIADNVCIPLYFLARMVKESDTKVVQVGEGADETMLGYWWVQHYLDKARSVYNPARERGRRNRLHALWANARNALFDPFPAEDLEVRRRAEEGRELFWGGAVCWWGDMRTRLTPDPAPFADTTDCPVENLLPQSFKTLDSHNVVEHYLSGIHGSSPDCEVLEKIPYMELKLRLPEHLLMRVDKLTMAHSIEARVPFLDHELLEFLNIIPSHYKLKHGLGKSLLKKAAEPYLDHDMLYRRKQGFGAPMESWFQDREFGRRALAAFERSLLAKEGYFDRSYFVDLMKHQMDGGGGYSFHLWTVLNAVLWHESWIEGNQACF